MKCYKPREADIFSEASGMGSHGQSRQITDVTWEHSPPLPQGTHALLSPSAIAVHSHDFACQGWIFSHIEINDKSGE